MIGENIRRRRLELGLTQEVLAKEVGTTKQTIGRYENGVIAIPSTKLELIVEALAFCPICGRGDYSD